MTNLQLTKTELLVLGTALIASLNYYVQIHDQEIEPEDLDRIASFDDRLADLLRSEMKASKGNVPRNEAATKTVVDLLERVVNALEVNRGH